MSNGERQAKPAPTRSGSGAFLDRRFVVVTGKGGVGRSSLCAAIALTARAGMGQDEVDAIWAEHGDDILLLNNIAHLRILSLPYTSPTRSLTARQREVLGWVGDGKTVQDIALLLNLTPATVEKHLRLARDALSVETTAQAVLKASFQNQIFTLEPS